MELMAARWFSQGRMIMSLPCTLDYVEDLIRKYASLQTFVPSYHATWPLYHESYDVAVYSNGTMFGLQMDICPEPTYIKNISKKERSYYKDILQCPPFTTNKNTNARYMEQNITAKREKPRHLTKLADTKYVADTK